MSLFVQAVLIHASTEIYIIRNIDSQLIKPLFDNIINHLPKKVYRYLLFKMMGMLVDLNITQNYKKSLN